MTPEAKRQLATTIRSLRERLLGDLHDATESAYRLRVRPQDAGLEAAPAARRARLEAWLAEQVRAEQAGASGKKKDKRRATEDFRRQVEKQAAYTLLNRVVFLRLLEAAGLRAPQVVTGGWRSRAYQDFRQLAPALARGDESEGYALLLRLVFEDLATDLPGLFGSAGVADLVPVPAPTLRAVVEALDDPVLASCWTDDMTLGWVYQYWNDPEREALDDKVNHGGKIEPYEIASKTQLFTDRYIVDWLLQNSLGPMWLAMCRKHGWQAEVEADGTLARLEERRVAWRTMRDAGEVSLTDLMPLETEAERHWAYYVSQPIPEDAIANAPKSVCEIRILDPAVGSGHFLIVAFELLSALYREEARHRGEEGQQQWSERAITESILERNLHGIDIDPRAVQIAAAALWLKARQRSAEAKPRRVNLVASNLRLAALPDDDPALVELRREVERETGIPQNLTLSIVQALRGADHIGSLLRVDAAVEEALRRCEGELGRLKPRQGDLFEGFGTPRRQLMRREEARATLVDRIESFLARHSRGDDLGLRLRGEQLTSGVRLVRILQEQAYDLVIANPPYHSANKLAAEANGFRALYPTGRADLFAAFMLRSIELLRIGGRAATVTLSNWMFLKAFSQLRAELLSCWRLCLLCDLGKGSFSSGSKLISASSQIFQRLPLGGDSIAVRAYSEGDVSSDEGRPTRNVAALLSGRGRHEFAPAALKVVPEWPLVYWWDAETLRAYQSAPLIGDGRGYSRMSCNSHLCHRLGHFERKRCGSPCGEYGVLRSITRTRSPHHERCRTLPSSSIGSGERRRDGSRCVCAA